MVDLGGRAWRAPGHGANRRPRRQWSTPPSGTQELAVELLDPDAPGGTFTHWLVYGISPGISSLAAARPAPRITTTSWFLALDTRLGLAAGARRSELESRISGHVLARGELVATCQRA